MPLDVLGRTRATLTEPTSSSPWPEGLGNLVKLCRAGDRALHLLLFNEECLVSACHQHALTRHSSLKSNNCNALSPARQSLTRLPKPSGQGDELVGSVSVARVRPRTSKGITDLLLPQTSIGLSR